MTTNSTERTLPTNLRAQAFAWARAARAYRDAMTAMERARQLLHRADDTPHPLAADPTTLSAFDVAIKCVRCDLALIERLAATAQERAATTTPTI